MNRKVVLFVVILSLIPLATPVSQTVSFQSANYSGSTVTQVHKVHNMNTSLSYATIQEAIDGNETLDGHVIFVDEGIYYEYLVVNKSISLVGENKDTTVIDCIGESVSLKANNTKIRGFTLQNGHYGIFMCSYTHGHNISGNIILNNDYGISGHYDCGNVSIRDNIIISNNITGIMMLFSHSRISNNLISSNGKGKFKEYSSGVQIAVGVNGRIIYCESNTITCNTIKNHQIGIWALQYSEDNAFFHNNFINNTKHVCIEDSANDTWYYGFEGNYWTGYNGADANYDGIGDTPYEIDASSRDNYPLMGMFSSFNTSLGSRVNIVSNSTVEEFEYVEYNSTIRMHVSNITNAQTYGFFRACIPHTIMNVSNISITIDDGLTPVLHQNYTLYDNSTYRWIYFAYAHSKHKIIIIPELPSFIIMPLFMMATVLAVIVYRRKHCIK